MLILRMIVKMMECLYETDRARLRAHHNRIRLGTPLKEPDSLEVIAGRHSCGGKNNIAFCHILSDILLLKVGDTNPAKLTRFFLIARPKAPLDLSAETPQRCRSKNASRGSTYSEKQIDTT